MLVANTMLIQWLVYLALCPVKNKMFNIELVIQQGTYVVLILLYPGVVVNNLSQTLHSSSGSIQCDVSDLVFHHRVCRKSVSTQPDIPRSLSIF